MKISAVNIQTKPMVMGRSNKKADISAQEKETEEISSSDCKEASGRCLVKQKKCFYDKYSKKEIFLKNGKAYDSDGNSCCATISVTDKKNNQYTLFYQKDGPGCVQKNYKSYKHYYYKDKVSLLKEKHTFADGTQLLDDEYFLTDDYKSTTIVTTNEDGSTTKSVIVRNKNPKYKNEPVFKFQKTEDSPVFSILNNTGEEITEFKTLKEAGEYFKREYGINAEFINLKQAYVLKQAVDKYAELNYEGKGKKLFDGLQVKIGSFENQNKFGVCGYSFRYNINNETFDGDMYNVPESDFVFLEGEIRFNSNFDWDGWECATEKERFERGNTHPNEKAILYMTHELAHYLHFQKSPKPGNNFTLNSKEKEIASLVSDYAKENRNEFIAEYISGRMSGIEYPQEVKEQYKKFGGPDLFGDFYIRNITSL